MNRLFSAKSLAVAAIALGAVGAASAAHARSDVMFSIGFNAPYGYGYVQPAPVYVEPQPVYVQPQPVYYGSSYVYEREWDRHHRREVRRYGPGGDADRDGVPNRFDHAPYNPYRR